MSAPTTIKEVLQDALALVRRGWIKGRSKKMRAGRACYCASGAIAASAPDTRLQMLAHLAMTHVITVFSGQRGRVVVSYNDAPGRTKAEIIAMFQRAIDRAA